MELSGNSADLRKLLVLDVLAVIAQVFLLFVLSWNIIAIIGFIILDCLLLSVGFLDWIYFSKKVILDVDGCTFVSAWATEKFTWEEINVQYTNNSSFFFGDSEIPGEGVILSVKPISKPAHIGAMTYCRFTHPGRSVFIRFSSPSFDRLIRTSAKIVYRGFVADKEEMLSFLKPGQQDKIRSEDGSVR